MAGDAAYLVARMPALNAPHVRRLVQVAGQTSVVGVRHNFGRIADIRRVRALGVFAPRAVAGLAAFALPAALAGFFDGCMRILLERFIYVFVARLAGVGPDIRGGLVV